MGTESTCHTFYLVLRPDRDPSKPFHVDVEEPPEFWRNVKQGHQVRFMTREDGATVEIDFSPTDGSVPLPFDTATIEDSEFHGVVHNSSDQWTAMCTVTTADGIVHGYKEDGKGPCSGCTG